MKLRKTIALTLAVLTIGMPAFRLDAANHSRVMPKTDTVYITETGTKYHRENCKFLAKSKIAIERADAIKKGYKACTVCKP